MELSILIPARNEMFVDLTVKDIVAHAESDYEIIVVMDGGWSSEGIDQHPRVNVVYHNQSIGQRAATNEAARISSGKYLMKVDAHCAFDQGFDVKMLADMQPDWTMLPVMRNLHIFDWVCPHGHRRYQGPSGVCKECGEPTTREIVWIAKSSPQSTAYRFDRSLHFQYWSEYKKKQEGDLVESMSIQGSCFMVTRDKFFELGLCDEAHGSWGQQGVEVACKTWLSGGRVIVTRKTWYAHLFRTQGEDFGFPYPNPGIEKARKYSRQLWLENRWDKAKYPLSWLINRFAPVPDWDDYKEPSKAIIYYTCNTHDPLIEAACRKQLREAAGSIPIIAVSLNQPIEFGDVNLQIEGHRSGATMHYQIMHGLLNCDADIVWFCESDVLYHPSHFNFLPKRDDIFYYNSNVWRVRYPDGHGVWTDNLKQVSGICAYRELLTGHYKKRIKRIQQNGGKFDIKIGYEPGAHPYPRGIDPPTKGGKFGYELWCAEFPNVDIRHDKTITLSKWSTDDFRDKRYAKGWRETDGDIPGWGVISGNLIETLNGIVNRNGIAVTAE